MYRFLHVICHFTCFQLNLWFYTLGTKHGIFTYDTFYVKLMTASCSMSNFLPIVIIFRQIIISEFYILHDYTMFNMFTSF